MTLSPPDVMDHAGAPREGDDRPRPAFHSRPPGRDHQFCVIGTFRHLVPLVPGSGAPKPEVTRDVLFDSLSDVVAQ